MAEKKTLKLSSRERRFGAALIDSILPMILMIILVILMIALANAGYHLDYDSYGYDYRYSYGNIAGYGIGLFICMMVMLAYLIVQIIFYTKSQSIGKAILGMQVVSSKNGKPVGIWWMLLRELVVKRASGEVFLLGYIWILIDKRNRGWHDKILDTYVVDIKPVAEPVVQPAVEPVAEPVVQPAVEPVAEDDSLTE